MKKINLFKYILFLLLLSVSFFLMASSGSVANASSVFQDVTPITTVVPATPIPDSGTGGNPTFFIPGWLVLLGIGFLAVILLLTLLRPALPADVPPHEHVETHDHTH